MTLLCFFLKKYVDIDFRILFRLCRWQWSFGSWRSSNIQIWSASSNSVVCPRSQRDLCLLPPESSSAALPPPSGKPLDILLCIYLCEVFFSVIRFPCFSYLQGTDSVFGEHVVRLKPEQDVRGHPLGPACLALSPHHLWLASVGQDGLLCVRETASMVDRLTYFFKTLQLYLP